MTAPVKIKANIMWACLEVPNDMSGKYEVDLCNLSDPAVQALSDMGLEVKNTGDDKGNFIKCRSTRPIHVFDEHGLKMDGLTVGNGSEGIAVVGSYAWTFKNKEGISPALKKLVITDLVIYGDAEAVTVDADDEIL